MDSQNYWPAKHTNNTSTPESTSDSNSDSSSYQERSPVIPIKYAHVPLEVAADHLRHYLKEADDNRDDAKSFLKDANGSLKKATLYLKTAKDKLDKVDKNLKEAKDLVGNMLATGEERMDSIKYYKRAYDISEEKGKKMSEALKERDEEVRRQAEEIARLRRPLEIGREHVSF